MITIGNKTLRAALSTKGAELQSLLHLENGLQYMWKGDPAVWGKFSPILFPIIGTLKEDSFSYEQKQYSLPRHGFARDMEFVVEEQTDHTATFLLTEDPVTLAKYPFGFELRLIYKVTGNSLSVTYSVTNPGTTDLFFSVGGHPAFAVPLESGTRYEDYYLYFEQVENTPRWPISPGGLIEESPIPCLENTQVLPLTKDLFQKDALVFKQLASSEVSLRSDKTSHGWSFDFSGFPYLGIWAAKGGDFVCIEPWCGIADGVSHNGNLAEKEGIVRLAPQKVFEASWTITCY